MRILPSIFEQRRFDFAEDLRLDELIAGLPGGQEIVKQPVDSRGQRTADLKLVAYLCPDESRDKAAARLIEEWQVSTPSMDESGLTFSCWSSLASETDPEPIMYTVRLDFAGTAHCSCPDFSIRGGACKHVRACLLRLDDLRQTPTMANLPQIPMPTSLADAIAVQHRRMQSEEGVTPVAPPIPAAGPVSRASLAAMEVLREMEDLPRPGTSDSDTEEDEPVVTTDSSDDELHYLDASKALSSKAGIDAQAVARVFFDVSRIAPKFREWVEYLKDVSPQPEDRRNAKAIHDNLKPFVDILGVWIGETSSGSGSTTTAGFHTTDGAAVAATVMPPRASQQHSQSSKRSWMPDIIGASPEKAQKRHNSHGWN
ncbi:hypothetical protein OE88DRAFT_1636180 [Heliocybe sulcata]|uniref:SWIM-type domain-containing protein n=1 Tax=Heliocybe sulcata TaxID=5364 RepID=A0A5C3MTA3_9AGAM|nr:hypothetical protein OE88DRAFT_1636180 [Heliocybe sulcata]